MITRKINTSKILPKWELNVLLNYPVLAFPLFAVVVFLPTFSNGFQHGWDDTWQVLRNPLVYNPSWENIVYHFTHFWEQQYSPINSLFYACLAGAFGLNASAFHTACLFVHLSSIFIVYGILIQILKKLLPQAEVSKTHIYAFFTALIFAVHPLQVESVAWISASKILLYALFSLLALRTYIRYIQTAHFWWLLVTAFAYILGFASKEQAIILPLNLLLIDYIWRRFDVLTWKKVVLSRVILEKIPFFLLAFGFWYFSYVNGTGSVGQSTGYPFYQRAVFALHCLTDYIFLFLAPVKLYFFHPFPISSGEELPLYFLGYILLMGIVFYFIWSEYRKGNRLVLVGFLFFVTNLLLVLHIIPFPRTVIIADRYMYLSVIGLSLILIWQVDQWLFRQSHSYKLLLVVASFVWLLFLGGQSYLRTQEWKNTATAKANVIDLIEYKKKVKEAELPPFNVIQYE
jgi:protein O-mannosyl-transferase